MPWHEVSAMDQRREFVRLAIQEGVNRRELCRRFGINPAVGYKWLGRWVGGDRDLADRSRCPHTSPNRCGRDRGLCAFGSRCPPGLGGAQDRALP